LVLLCLLAKSLAKEYRLPPVTLQPDPSPDVMPFYRDWTKGGEPHVSRKEIGYAMIPEDALNSFPHYGSGGCAKLGVTTEDRRQGIVHVIPPGVNPMPATYPDAN
jgi:hypothetical protein